MNRNDKMNDYFENKISDLLTSIYSAEHTKILQRKESFKEELPEYDKRFLACQAEKTSGFIEGLQVAVNQLKEVKEEMLGDYETYSGNKKMKRKNVQDTELIFNRELSENLVHTLHSDCSECEEQGKRQNFSSNGCYYDEASTGGKGVYPLIYCFNCEEYRESGDSEFHDYYEIVDGKYVEPK